MNLSRQGWSLQLPNWFSAAHMGRGARTAEPLPMAAQQQGRGVGDGCGFEEQPERKQWHPSLSTEQAPMGQQKKSREVQKT